jgi:hypothetical protein
MSHADASDEALAAARDVVERIVAKAPRIRRNLEENHFEVHVSAYGHALSELPEFRTRRGTLEQHGDDFDAHMEGGKCEGRTVACTEGTLVPKNEGHCAHEIAHAIEVNALVPSLRARLYLLYAKSMDAGRWKGAYAATSHAELFAEATRLWLFDPKKLQREDPEMFAFVRALYEDQIDPGPAPREETVRPSAASEAAGMKSGAGRVPVRVRVTNGTSARIRVQWIDFDGKRDTRLRLTWLPQAAPGETIDVVTFSSHAFAVLDAEGGDLAAFVAPTGDALVEVK